MLFRSKMKAKEYLSQAYRLDKRINSKLDQIASLSELATKCTSTLTGLPRNPNRGGSTVADAIGNVIDLQVEINNDIDRLVDLKRELVKVIKCHPANKNSKRKRNKIAGEEEKRVPKRRDSR